MSTFQGKYVEDVRLAIVAAAISHTHAVIIGEPGTGKTAIARAVADAIYGPAKHVFIRLAATTPPEKVEGMPDPVAALQNGEYKLIRTNTAYDPNAAMLILDELGRPMDPVFDILLDVMDRQDVDSDKAPVVIGTSNFMPTSSRTEAMVDRIAIWLWIPNEDINVADFVSARMTNFGKPLTVNNSLPTLQDIERVYQAVPGPNAIKAVTLIVEQLKQEAEVGSAGGKSAKKNQTPFVVNRRRISQWVQILFRMSYYITGDADFAVVPQQAKRVLQWCYPTLTREEALEWQARTEALADPLEAAVQAIKEATFNIWKEELSKNPNMRAAQIAMAMGQVMAKGQEDINKLIKENPEKEEWVNGQMDDLMKSMSDIVRDGTPF